MRNIVLILVFLNATFFLWLYAQHSPKKPQPNTSAQVQTLELYTPKSLAQPTSNSAPLPVVTGSSEPLNLNTPKPTQTSPRPLDKRPQTERPKPKTDPSHRPTPIASNNDSCVWIGPIADKGRAIGAQEYLIAQGRQATWLERQHTGEPVKFAYRVFIPSYPSYEAAKEATDALKEKGVEDFYMITKSETKQYAIALGVFSRMEGVKIRSEEVRKMGFQTDYEIREREQNTVFWVIVNSTKPLTIEDKKTLSVFGIEMTYTKKACKSA